MSWTWQGARRLWAEPQVDLTEHPKVANFTEDHGLRVPGLNYEQPAIEAQPQRGAQCVTHRAIPSMCDCVLPGTGTVIRDGHGGAQLYPNRHGSQSIQDQLGRQYFAQSGKPAAPDLTKLLTIGHMARACGVKINTIWHYEAAGILPPSIKGSRNRRMWPQEYIRSIEQIAIDEGLHDKPRRQINSTRFSERAWDPYYDLHPDVPDHRLAESFGQAVAHQEAGDHDGD